MVVKASPNQQIIFFIYLVIIFSILINTTVAFFTPPEQFGSLESPKVNTTIGILLGMLLFYAYSLKLLNFRGIEQFLLFITGFIIFFSLNIISYLELNLDATTKATIGKFSYGIQLLGLFIAFIPTGMNRQLFDIWYKTDASKIVQQVATANIPMAPPNFGIMRP